MIIESHLLQTIPLQLPLPFPIVGLGSIHTLFATGFSLIQHTHSEKNGFCRLIYTNVAHCRLSVLISCHTTNLLITTHLRVIIWRWWVGGCVFVLLIYERIISIPVALCCATKMNILYIKQQRLSANQFSSSSKITRERSIIRFCRYRSLAGALERKRERICRVTVPVEIPCESIHPFEIVISEQERIYSL